MLITNHMYLFSTFITLAMLMTSTHQLDAQQPFGGRPRYTQPTALANVINNAGDGPDNPSITDDGLTLFFDVPPIGQTNRSKIWSATRTSVDSEWENARPLEGGVNSFVRHLEPDVTGDGLEIYFRRSDVALNYDLVHETDRLMMATRASIADPWDVPIELPESINSAHCVGAPSVSGDGLELYYSVVIPTNLPCQFRYADLYVSERITRNDPWGEPHLAQAKAWNPSISSDGLQLYFMDGRQLWVKSRHSRDEEFGTPVELGSPPNTSATTGTAVSGPEVSADGDTLFFASDRSGTPRGYGIWQTTPAELCDINGDGLCDVNDVSTRALLRLNLTEGSERESDILRYDISGDGRVDQNDLRTWLVEAARSNGLSTPYVRGDADLDGKFDSTDLINVFGAGKYELGSVASWSEGDWTGDRRFDSGDVIAAFEDGGYELGSLAAVRTVPEPTSAALLLIGMTIIHRLRQQR